LRHGNYYRHFNRDRFDQKNVQSDDYQIIKYTSS
jgi:hypothetical protein